MGITIPKLEEYDIKILVALGNQANDLIRYNRIKYIIIERLLETNKPLFYLLNRFVECDKILKEAYAEVITMRLKNNDYIISESVMLEIVKLVSLDTLMYYGMESDSLNFAQKCKKEFWERAIEVEDKIELRNKINLNNKNIKSKKIKRKGD